MKKYLFVLFLLAGFGLVLGYLTVRDNNRLDSEVYLQTSESIRNLKLLSNDVDMLLLSSRLGSVPKHEQLSDAIFAVSEEFDNLRYDALFEEIEANPVLNDAVAEFDNALRTRQENIDQFIDSNAILKAAERELPARGLRVQEKLTNRQASSIVERSNATLSRFLITKDSISKGYLKTMLLELSALSNAVSPENKESLTAYIDQVDILLDYSVSTNIVYQQLSEQTSTDSLNRISNAYSNYHNQLIDNSNQLRNAWVVYGIVLLATLLYFAYQLRRSFVGLENKVSERTQEIERTLGDLRESQEQLIQSEKMASLGELAAGIAHEINTPLGYVSSNVDTLDRNLQNVDSLFSLLQSAYQEAKSPNRDNKKLSGHLSSALKLFAKNESVELLAESRDLLADNQHGLNEISELVLGLKDFVRLDRQETEPTDLNICLNNALRIGNSLLEKNRVEVARDFSAIPELRCTPSKINQVFLNVISNAAQAMSGSGGILKISSRYIDNQVQIRFEDQGIGMDETTLQKMFDPFFTTKPVGEGTGLGMSIAYKIMQSHNGHIDVSTQLNEGSVVTLFFPLQQTEISEAA